MADSIVRLTVDSQEYDNKLKRAAEQLNRYADGCRKAGGTLEHVDEGVLEFTRSLGRMETTANTARAKLAEMTKAFTDLSVQYKNMTEEEKKGEFGKALNASLTELKGRIQESKVQLDDVSKSLNSGGGLSCALDAVAGKFGLSIDQVTKFGGVVGVATTAVQVAKDAFFQSESGIDEWGRTVEGAKSAYSVFLDTLNNGNWSQFFQNLARAIQGGRDLYDIFDRLGSIKSNNAAAIAIVQQQIAQLRLAKQQGENVDAQLKAATAQLAQLQKQSINAGKAAGNKSAFEVIRNGVNSVGGAGVNDATIQYAVQQIMKNGQSEFDKYRRNYQILQEKGTRTTVTALDDGMGGTVNKYSKSFDINLLTSEQQKQYALAKSITEGETRIQKGIAAYAQAVQEGTASAREEFKGNRYALQGSGSGGRSVTGISKTDTTEFQQNQQTINTLTQEYVRISDNANEETRKRQDEIQKEIQLLMRRNDLLKLYAEQAVGKLQGGDISASDLGSTNSLSGKDFLNIGAGLSEDVLPKATGLAKAGNDVAKSWQSAAAAVSNIGSAFSSIEDPATRVVGTIAQAVASIALGYATATAQAAEYGPWVWAGFAAGGLAQMLAMIASIHEATGYAQGGEIKGNSYSGDNIGGLVDGNQLVGLNAGEIVLNHAQQANLANSLQGGGFGNMQIVGVLDGETIKLCLNRHFKRSGEGELVTWGGH